MTTIVRAVQTCQYFPSQWDAWTDAGQYLYLRYRHGVGTVEEQPGPDTATWTDHGTLGEFETDGEDGEISLEDFCAAADLTLALTRTDTP
jgi:hypothetical protein